MTPQPSARAVELNRAIRAILAEQLHSGVADPRDLREAACEEFTLDDCVTHLATLASWLALRIAEKQSVFVWAALGYSVTKATLVLDPESEGATRHGPLIEFAHAAHASGQGASAELGAAAAEAVATRHGDAAFVGGVLICAELLHLWGEAHGGQTAQEALSGIALWQEGEYGDGVPDEAGATR